MDSRGLSETDFAGLELIFTRDCDQPYVQSVLDGRSSPDSCTESIGSSLHGGLGACQLDAVGDDAKSILQKKYKIPKPRILRNDFRRFYASMWVNVFNSADKPLMIKHLNTFYVPNVSIAQADLRYDRAVHPQVIPMYQDSAKGVDYLGHFWYKGMTYAPDMVCSVRHTTLKVRSDGTSSIKCAFVLKGTMTALLDDQKEEDIARIARYQAHQAKNPRDITFTEAAIVAVAPPKIVQVPGGKAEILTQPLQPIKLEKSTSQVSLTSLGSNGELTPPGEISPKTLRQKSPMNNTPKIIKAEPEQEFFQAPADYILSKMNMPLSCKSMDSIMTEDLMSTSSASEMSGTSPKESTSSQSRKRRSRDVSSAVKAEPLLRLPSTDSVGSTGRKRAAGKALTPTGESASPLTNSNENNKRSNNNTNTSNNNNNNNNYNNNNNNNTTRRSRKTTSEESSALDAAARAKIDWLSVAETAYEAGVLEACQTHSAKQYFYSEPAVEPTAAEMLSQHISGSRDSDTGRGESAMQVGNCASIDSLDIETGHASSGDQPPAEDESSTLAVAERKPAGKKLLLTAKIDCICSLELELNADSLIVAVAVNYFR